MIASSSVANLVLETNTVLVLNVEFSMWRVHSSQLPPKQEPLSHEQKKCIVNCPKQTRYPN